VIEDLMRAMKLIARDKEFIFKKTDISAPMIFKGERQDLEEMVGNILENASKWAKLEIQISCFRQDHMIHIVIADDGVGIAPSVRDSVFSRGERLDETVPGTGLGLSIVKDLIGFYGGDIILSDNNKGNKNKGLSVELILPSL
jgi:signal transduction histidine kinase